MTTNYYATGLGLPSIGTRVHLGLSASGWVFQLRVYPNLGISSWADWWTLLSKPGVRIWDEYKHRVSLSDFLKVVTERERGSQAVRSAEWWLVNQAEPGPCGLARSRAHLVYSYGEGTWECHDKDFS